MKKYFTLSVLMLTFIMSISSLALEDFFYKGISLDAHGQILANDIVDVRITVSSGTSGNQYQEIHTNKETDQFAAFVVKVGTGTKTPGSVNLEDIESLSSTKIKVETKKGASDWVLSVVESLYNIRQQSLNQISDFAWSLKGNNGTIPGTNYLGTNDNQGIFIDVRNNDTLKQSVRIDSNLAFFRETEVDGIITGVSRGEYAVDLQIVRDDSTQVASGWYSVIGGGGKNTANGSVVVVSGGFQNFAQDTLSTIGGGGFNNASHWYSTVSGGGRNIAAGIGATVGGGGRNTANGDYYSTVGGGYQNQATSSEATIGGGWYNTASEYGATVGGGGRNKATNKFSTISGGLGALADKFGQYAYASGYFSNAGDAQASLFLLRNYTTDSTTTDTLLIIGPQFSTLRDSFQLTLNEGDRWTFKALVVGSSSDGTNFASYEIRGFIMRNGTTTAIAGVTTTTIAESDAAYNATADADDDEDALMILVTGDTVNTMRWVARVDIVQLNY